MHMTQGEINYDLYVDVDEAYKLYTVLYAFKQFNNELDKVRR
jgi:hypothetical protein